MGILDDPKPVQKTERLRSKSLCAVSRDPVVRASPNNRQKPPSLVIENDSPHIESPPVSKIPTKATPRKAKITADGDPRPGYNGMEESIRPSAVTQVRFWR